MNVAVIPGFLGTSLYDNITDPLQITHQVWINYLRLHNGALAYLDLAADGDGPGPLAGGVVLRPSDPENAYYGGLISAIRDAGNVCYGVGWDWRKDLADEAFRVYLRLQLLFGTDPVVLVAHSAGGLVARYVADLYGVHGHADSIRKLIFLGTPHYGTYAVVDHICRQSSLYVNIARVMYWRAGSIGDISSPILDAVLADTVALWQLLPAWGFGPFWQADQAGVSALYGAPFWHGVNVNVSQARLDAARVAWGRLQLRDYPDKSVYLAGTDQKTPAAVVLNKAGTALQSCAYKQDGDTVVELQSAHPAGLGSFVTRSDWAHDALPYLPSCQRAVVQYIPPE